MNKAATPHVRLVQCRQEVESRAVLTFVCGRAARGVAPQMNVADQRNRDLNHLKRSVSGTCECVAALSRRGGRLTHAQADARHRAAGRSRDGSLGARPVHELPECAVHAWTDVKAVGSLDEARVGGFTSADVIAVGVAAVVGLTICHWTISRAT